MKVLIIGYGSIGKRHDEVLSKFDNINIIDIVTKQTISGRTTYTSLIQIEDLNTYDYFIIASQTHKHYEQLNHIESNTKGKIIFCEKPLFEKNRALKIENNQVFVGYVLRFHPLLQKLKSFLETEKVLSVNVNCGQYLPTWRPNTNYRNSYSAKKDEGGGVLLDLSHEIDYIQWLFGTIIDIKSYQVKISDLEIDSDDFTTFIGKTQRKVIVNLSIDYINKLTYRRVLVHTLNNTYELDLIKNNLIQKDKTGLEQTYSFSNLERNYLFEQMHTSILSNRNNACSYNEGVNVMGVISTIQEQNR